MHVCKVVWMRMAWVNCCNSNLSPSSPRLNISFLLPPMRPKSQMHCQPMQHFFVLSRFQKLLTDANKCQFYLVDSTCDAPWRWCLLSVGVPFCRDHIYWCREILLFSPSSISTGKDFWPKFNDHVCLYDSIFICSVWGFRFAATTSVWGETHCGRRCWQRTASSGWTALLSLQTLSTRSTGQMARQEAFVWGKCLCN